MPAGDALTGNARSQRKNTVELLPFRDTVGQQAVTPPPPYSTGDDILDIALNMFCSNERRGGSFFADCPRDEHGHCLAAGGEHVVTPEELKHAQQVAQKKARNVPKPTPEELKAAEVGLAKLGANKFRKTLNGNSTDRARRREALLKEFGDGKQCPCVYCGLKLEHGTLEQDKIVTTAKGGRYRLPNLVPACGGCNKQRGDLPWSKIKFAT
jgi:hypothetical protein